MYRIGFPGWKIAARFNVPLLLRVEVQQDKVAGVYLATSPDLAGLVVEVPTLDDLFKEVYLCIEMLLEEQLKRPPATRPLAAWDGVVCIT